jgi:N-methylhydantoinase B
MSTQPVANVDKVTFEVIRNKLVGITEELAITLKSVSGSPIVAEATDYNISLHLADGALVTTGRTAMFQAGSTFRVIRHVIADCQDDPGIADGDMFIVNNPYKGAIHPPDVSIVSPIFHEGEIIGWSGACAHQLDVGGMDFGSWCPKATEIQQECMILPPLKIVREGRIIKDVWNTIMSMSRLPFIVGLDFKAMIAANNVARKRFGQLIERYGVATIQTVMNGLISMTEDLVRARLRELPDGQVRSENFLDHDGHQNKLYRAALTVTKKGDSLTFDLSESSKQAPGFINCTESGLLSGIFSGTLPLLAYDIPWNEGILKPWTVIAPSGIVCNAEWPAPVGSATCAMVWVVENAVVEALSKLASCHATASYESQAVSDGSFATLNLAGLNQYGEPFGTMFLEPLAGGAGAFGHKDGVDADGCHSIPALNIENVETNENFAPVLYLHRRLTKDSGGMGKFRGGRSVGMAFTLHKVDTLSALLVGHGVESPNAVGIFGGYPGACNVNHLVRGSNLDELFAARELPADLQALGGEHINLGSKPGRIPLAAGDVFEYTWQGGGGFGDPLERDPDKVMADMADVAISAVTAGDGYGVVFDERDLSVDAEATETKRDQIREARRARGRGKPAKLSGEPGRTLAPLGRTLRFAEMNGDAVVVCDCGYVLSSARENWKEYATAADVGAEQLGRLVLMHEDLVAHEYSCPQCGKLLSVDIGLKGEPPLFDVQLDVDGLLR